MEYIIYEKICVLGYLLYALVYFEVKLLREFKTR